MGIIPFTRQLAGDIPDNFIQTDIVSPTVVITATTVTTDTAELFRGFALLIIDIVVDHNSQPSDRDWKAQELSSEMIPKPLGLVSAT